PFTEVEVGSVAGTYGDQLVDAEGRSLYLFTLDDERTSTCEGACAGAWPPLLGDPVADAGVDQALLGNAERGDGSIQVTYAGHPLYFYSGDASPGETNGHGFNDVWFLVSPGGEALTG
ncbi:MAG: COG4315 family predicted lipoprotein, partial [Acidimicrobiia bacterium]